MSEKKYQIVDLGVWHPDYFQGFGTSYTRFEHCTYGIGYTSEDAYQDALDSMGSDFALFGDLPEHCPFDGNVPDDRGADGEVTETAWYHVGIRWNT